MFCKVLTNLVDANQSEENARPLKLYTMTQIELNGLTRKSSQKAIKYLSENFKVPASFLNKMTYSYRRDRTKTQSECKFILCFIIYL